MNLNEMVETLRELPQELWYVVGIFSLIFLCIVLYALFNWRYNVGLMNQERVFLEVVPDSRSIDITTRLSQAQNFIEEASKQIKPFTMSFELVKTANTIKLYISYPNHPKTSSIAKKIELLDGVGSIKEVSEPNVQEKYGKRAYPKYHYELFQSRGKDLFTRIAQTLNQIESGSFVISFAYSERKPWIKGKVKSLNVQSKKENKVNHNIADEVKRLKTKVSYPLVQVKPTIYVSNRDDSQAIESVIQSLNGDNDIKFILDNSPQKKARFIPVESFLAFLHYPLVVSWMRFSADPHGIVMNSSEASQIIHIPAIKNGKGVSQEVAE